MKRELCIVHIGTHKTGSSSLQKFLKTYLNSNKFHYANSSELNHNRILLSILMNQAQNYHGNTTAGLSVKDLSGYINNERHILESSFLSGDLNVIEIISAEDLCNISTEQVRMLKSYLNNFFNRVQIIVYLRDINSYASSSFQELVKHGLNKFDLNLCLINLNSIFDYYNLFGSENVLLLDYNEAVNEKGGVIIDFCDKIGLHYEDMVIEIELNLNKSLTLEATCFIFLFQKYYYRILNERFWIYQNNFINFFNDFGDFKFNLGSESCDFIKNKTIQIINQDFKELISDLIFRDDAIDNFNVINSDSDIVDVCLSKLNDLLIFSKKKGIVYDLNVVNEFAAVELLKVIDTFLNGEDGAFLVETQEVN